MGFPSERFIRQDISEDFFCSICQDILQDPIILEACEHLFCRSCITDWLEKNQTCPIDRSILPQSLLTNLRQPQRLIRNLLNDLELRCEYYESGCQEILKLGLIETHQPNCGFHPNNQSKPCPGGCKANLTRIQSEHHTCVAYLLEKLKLKEANETGELESFKNAIAKIKSGTSVFQCLNSKGDPGIMGLVADITTQCVRKYELPTEANSSIPMVELALEIKEELDQIFAESWACVISLGSGTFHSSTTTWTTFQTTLMNLTAPILNITVWKRSTPAAEQRQSSQLQRKQRPGPSRSMKPSALILLSKRNPSFPFDALVPMKGITGKFRLMVSSKAETELSGYSMKIYIHDNSERQGCLMGISLTLSPTHLDLMLFCGPPQSVSLVRNRQSKRINYIRKLQAEITFTLGKPEYEMKVNNEEPFLGSGIAIDGSDFIKLKIDTWDIGLSSVKLERL